MAFLSLDSSTLSTNPFFAAAVGRCFTDEAPGRWSRPPTEAIVPPPPSMPIPKGNLKPKTDLEKGSPMSDLGLSPPNVNATAQECNTTHLHGNVSSLVNEESDSTLFDADSVKSRSSGINFPLGLSTRPSSSGPAAWLLTREGTDDGYLITPTRGPLSVQRNVLVDQDEKDVSCEEQQIKSSESRPSLTPTLDKSQPRVNELQNQNFLCNSCRNPYSCPIGTYTTDATGLGIPNFEYGVYPENQQDDFEPLELPYELQYDQDELPFYTSNITRLPDDPKECLAYFEAFCQRLISADMKENVIPELLIETDTQSNNLDDSIFEMNDAINPERLHYTNGALMYPYLKNFGRDSPSTEYIEKWYDILQQAASHLRCLSDISYNLVLSRNKIMIIWQALIMYRDDWANSLFSNSHDPNWEVSSQLLGHLKQYHAFNREMQRLLRNIEDDLILVGRFENQIQYFRESLMKTDEKFQNVRKIFEL